MPLGPVMLDIAGTALTDDDRVRLRHHLVGGVILFSRNYNSPEQIVRLCGEIRELRDPPLLVTVDHEGGRVQRFKTGFTIMPPMALLGRLWDQDRDQATAMARAAGVLIAAELAAGGVDLSFTPVLDLDYGSSGVIGDRAFHRDPEAVAELAGALMTGLRERGMRAVGKHFPGHGFAPEDSHLEMPADRRTLDEIATDLVPYKRLIPLGLAAVMPAHVTYPAVDGAPAGFSRIWLQRILREELGFRGLIFSDDLSMEGAAVAGGIVQRGEAALGAGCDMVLVCNRPSAADELLAGLRWHEPVGWAERVRSLYCTAARASFTVLAADAAWREARLRIAELPALVAGAPSIRSHG
jgi:beta-N-acetylhexosaminidase